MVNYSSIYTTYINPSLAGKNETDANSIIYDISANYGKLEYYFTVIRLSQITYNHTKYCYFPYIIELKGSSLQATVTTS